MKKKKWIIPVFVILILITASISISFLSLGSSVEESPKAIITKSREPIGYSKEYANISLKLLEGWEYDTFEGDKESAPEGEDPYFGIEIWPCGHSDGKIAVEFCPYFGVCGTGLKTEKTVIGDYEGTMGIYDNSEIWSFIILNGEPQRDYVILNDGTEEWWSDYEDEAMAILDTLLVGTDIADTNN